MDDDRKPRIDKVTGTFERRGTCEGCGKKVKPSKTFTATTHEGLMAAGASWTEPLRHRGCW